MGAAQKAFDILSETPDLRDKLESNTAWFREKIQKAGFTIQPGETPIVPIMLFDAKLAQNFAAFCEKLRLHYVAKKWSKVTFLKMVLRSEHSAVKYSRTKGFKKVGLWSEYNAVKCMWPGRAGS